MPKPSRKCASLSACLSFTLLLSLAEYSPGYAAQPALWSQVNIPAEGSSGKWQLASGSDVKLLTVTADGTLFAHANPSGSNNTLFKSSDNGISWAACTQVTGNVTALCASPDDKNRIYYATDSTVFLSNDAGSTFTAVAARPGSAGSANVAISFLAVAGTGSARIIAAGTKNRTPGLFGGIYTINENNLSGNWTDTGLANCDVTAIAFSPNYNSDGRMAAAASTENGTLVVFRSGNSSWGAQSGNATISGISAEAAVICLPPDYGSVLFLGITANNSGDVYKITRTASPGNSSAVDLNVAAVDNFTALDVGALTVKGSGGNYFLAAGAARTTRIYLSDNGGGNWSRSGKEPSGGNITQLAAAPDFAGSRRIWAGTSGEGSAFSISTDAGQTWNQLSLIDTTISALVDLAVSPRFQQDSTLFLLTWGGEHSLWRSRDSGTNWERVYTANVGGAAGYSNVELSPDYGFTDSAVILAGDSGQGTIWKSADAGQTFVRRIAGFPVDVLAVAGSDAYFIGSYNGTNSLIYRTANGGVSYYSPTAAGIQPMTSIALSPGFQQDGTILAGNSNGLVYLSINGGANFDLLPAGANSSISTGSVSVAFDWQYPNTKLVYAASDNSATSSSRVRLYRYTVGTSQAWESLDTMLEIGARLGQIRVLPGGSLYAANSRDDGGMERSLNPGAASYPTFEKVNIGLSGKAALNGLWCSGSQLWSLDTRNNQLMTYVDSLLAPVVPGYPAAEAGGVNSRDATIDWLSAAGAISYEWQVDNDGSFSTVSAPFRGETIATSAKLPRLDPGSAYYWRVRVKLPTSSPWSPVRTFYTSLGTPGSLPELFSPKPAAEGVSIRPAFSWSAVSGADCYEFMLSIDSLFNSPVVIKIGDDALPVNAWQCDLTLSYNTTYFWKIRALSRTSFGPWSGVGAFTTQAPVQVPQPQPPALADLKVELVSPPYGTQAVALLPVFEWKYVTGADKYELLVSRNDSFTYAEIARIGTSALSGTIWRSDITLDYQTTYYWKVRAVNGGNTSGWSGTYSFRTIPALPDPMSTANIVLENPKTGSQGVIVRPIFQWRPVTGAEGYELVVSNNHSFNNTVIDKSGLNALKGNVWQSDTRLEYQATYYWKVRAVCGSNRSAWSDAGVFITAEPPGTNMNVPELESPKAGAEGVSVMPVFQWKSIAGAASYELLVSKSNSLDAPLISKIGQNALSANAWRCDIELDKGTAYYWKVRAIDGRGTGPWSSVNAFVTEANVIVPIQAAVQAGPARVELLSPVGIAIGAVSKPLFEWKAVPGAVAYELVVSKDQGFTNPSILRAGDFPVPLAMWQSDVMLEAGTTYYWKVRAVAGKTTGEWSIPGVFVTGVEDEPPIVLQAQTDLPQWAVYTGYALTGAVGLLIGVILLLAAANNKGQK